MRRIIQLELLTFLLIVPSPGYAQVGQAQLSGDILDTSGAVISGAAVVLMEVHTNSEVRTVTGPSGTYVFFPVKPGVYRITAEAPGFQRVVRDGVTSVTGERIHVDLQLQVGQTEQSVNVTSGAPLLRTDSA